MKITKLKSIKEENINIDNISFEIVITNGESQIISNETIKRYHGDGYDSHIIKKINDFLIILIISKASGQESSIGIWDIRISNWCFKTNVDDYLLSPSEFLYDNSQDTFYFYENIFINDPIKKFKGWVENYYKIDSNRKFEYIKKKDSKI